MTKVAAFAAGALAAGTVFMTVIFGTMISNEINSIRMQLYDEMDVFRVSFDSPFLAFLTAPFLRLKPTPSGLAWLNLMVVLVSVVNLTMPQLPLNLMAVITPVMVAPHNSHLALTTMAHHNLE